MRGWKASRKARWMLAALLAAFAAMPASGQTYPSHPVKIVLPIGVGGVADTSSRIIADKFAERLGQRFLVENIPGAGGISAAKAVLAAPADGYTLGLVTNGTAISAAFFTGLPFDPAADFEMISTLGTFDLVFAVISSANTWMREGTGDTSWLYGCDAWSAQLDQPAAHAAAASGHPPSPLILRGR